MTVIMRGAEVAAQVRETCGRELSVLRGRGTEPLLAIVRVGQRAGDLAYERGALKTLAALGIAAKVRDLAADVGEATFERELAAVCGDPSVHGVLLLRPLPPQLDEQKACLIVPPQKDVDGINPLSAARVFAGEDGGFAPCTPCAVMEMLAHYGVPLVGSNVAVMGRSMVVGRPLAMLLLREHATVTLCHTKTRDPASLCRDADIVVAAVGRARVLTKDFFSPRSVVVDVGINMDAAEKLCGDVDFDEVAPHVAMISPVPGGVGAVTTSVLAMHVVQAAARQV